MAITNYERVGKTIELLKSGLSPFAEREFKSAYKDRASAEASRFLDEDRLALPPILLTMLFTKIHLCEPVGDKSKWWCR